jgi:hypothetical protein
VLAIGAAAVFPETATASTLVAMTVAAIIGLTLSAVWAAEVLQAVRQQRGVALAWLVWHAGTIAVFFGGSLLFLFSVLFTIGLVR